VSCKHCGEKHSAKVRVFLDNGPLHELSLAAFMADRSPSAALDTLLHNTICICPASGEQFVQDDPTRVYLAPAPEHAEAQAPDQAPAICNEDFRSDFLGQLARAFARHPRLSQSERERFSIALLEISAHPAASAITGEVLLSMLFPSPNRLRSGASGS
jgi:hypothetical protein